MMVFTAQEQREFNAIHMIGRLDALVAKAEAKGDYVKASYWRAHMMRLAHLLG